MAILEISADSPLNTLLTALQEDGGLIIKGMFDRNVIQTMDAAITASTTFASSFFQRRGEERTAVDDRTGVVAVAVRAVGAAGQQRRCRHALEVPCSA